MGLFRIGKAKETSEELGTFNTIKALAKEFEDINSKPLSEKELLKEILNQLYLIRGKFEILDYKL